MVARVATRLAVGPHITRRISGVLQPGAMAADRPVLGIDDRRLVGFAPYNSPSYATATIIEHGILCRTNRAGLTYLPTPSLMTLRDTTRHSGRKFQIRSVLIALLCNKLFRFCVY